MSSFDATFPREPSKYPYTKQSVSAKRNARVALDNQFFFDLVLSEVAQIPSATKYYPPRSTADLRQLHEAIENGPVDSLKKQCCLYYLLRDWDVHQAYADNRHIPSNYCSLMDSYWYLDNQRYQEALLSLTTPGLTPNFATKILSTFSESGNYGMVVTYVQTLQNALDTEVKLKLYLDALMKVTVEGALYFTRTVTPDLRRRRFEDVLDFAKGSKETALLLTNFPFDTVEEEWAYTLLSRYPGIGLEALILRLTMLGKLTQVLELREKHGGGQPDLNQAMREQINPIDLKLVQ